MNQEAWDRNMFLLLFHFISLGLSFSLQYFLFIKPTQKHNYIPLKILGTRVSDIPKFKIALPILLIVVGTITFVSLLNCP